MKNKHSKKKQKFPKKNNDKQHDSIKINMQVLTPLVDELIKSMVLAMIEAINDDKPDIQLQTIQCIRQAIASTRNPPIKEFVDQGIIPLLVRLLKQTENPKMQVEVAWILTNIASGETEITQKVVSAGAVPILIKLLKSADVRVCEQSVWALGNVIGDGAQRRNYVIRMGIVPPLVDLCKSKTSIELLRQVAWVLSQLCRFLDPPTPNQIIKKILPQLSELIKYKDELILRDISWAFSYVTNNGSDSIKMVVDIGVVSRMVPLLSCVNLQTPILRALGNIVADDDNHTQAVLDCNVLDYFPALLNHADQKIQKEAVWFLSNILAGTQSQKQTVIDAGLLPIITYKLSNGSFKGQKEAAWAVSNLMRDGNLKQLEKLVETGFLRPLCKMLECSDAPLVKAMLNGILKMLNTTGSRTANIVEMIEDYDGVGKIDELQNHPNVEIYYLAYDLITKFF